MERWDFVNSITRRQITQTEKSVVVMLTEDRITQVS
jgi:hypothetical protein